MKTSDEEMNGNEKLGRDVRRLATSDSNRRHLLALPQFRVEQDVPDRIGELLRRLETANSRTAGD